ncbi:MAG TPA: hypothetical protein VJ648_07330 [Vicinamibacteria bacterium]|nr:hypothetical protein [Vicinamibacteria bacterium]
MAKPRPGRGQTALVTGASGGIGVDVAARLAREHGVTATPVANDLGAASGGQRLAEKVAGLGLTVDVLVNNAGYGHAGALTSSVVVTGARNRLLAQEAVQVLPRRSVLRAVRELQSPR